MLIAARLLSRLPQPPAWKNQYLAVGFSLVPDIGAYERQDGDDEIFADGLGNQGSSGWRKPQFDRAAMLFSTRIKCSSISV